MRKIILATASPHRIEAFRSLGLDIIVEPSNIGERTEHRPDTPEGLVKYLARLKAEHIANKPLIEKNHSDGIVMGFDSVGYFNSTILEKPETKEEGFDRLRMLSGNRHEFFTGVQMIDIKTAQQLERVAWTSITLRSLSDEEIEQYLENGDYKKLALGYNVISGFSSTFVRRIEGSLTSLAHGVPLDDVIEMLSSLSKT